MFLISWKNYDYTYNEITIEGGIFNEKVLGLILTMLLVVAVVTACGSTRIMIQRIKARQMSPLPIKMGHIKRRIDFDDRGWKAQIQIKVEGGKIKDVVYDGVNQEGKKSEDEDYHKIQRAKGC